MGDVIGMIKKAAQTTRIFCDNPLCKNHVTVSKDCWEINVRGAESGNTRICSHNYFKGREIIRFCDVCKKAIQMVE